MALDVEPHQLVLAKIAKMLGFLERDFPVAALGIVEISGGQ